MKIKYNVLYSGIIALIQWLFECCFKYIFLLHEMQIKSRDLRQFLNTIKVYARLRELTDYKLKIYIFIFTSIWAGYVYVIPTLI